MTQANTFNLIEDLWIANLLMDVGVSRTKVDARIYPLKLGSYVYIYIYIYMYIYMYMCIYIYIYSNM